MANNGKRRSDDSILEDAAAAREEERLGQVAPEDQLEHSLEEVRDSPQKAAMSGASKEEVARLERKILQLEKALTETMKSQVLSTDKMKELRAQHLKRSEIPECPHCHQFITCCATADKDGNNHVTLRVLPDRQEHMESFPGVIWNNVVYCGIEVVPAIAANDILAAVRNWEEYKFGLNRNRGRTIGRSHAITENIPRGGFPIFSAQRG